MEEGFRTLQELPEAKMLVWMGFKLVRDEGRDAPQIPNQLSLLAIVFFQVLIF